MRHPARGPNVRPLQRTSSTARAHPVNLLILRVGGHRYGLPVEAVQELVRAVSITPLPDAPPAVEGVMSLRGAATPVFGLRRRFGLPERVLDPHDFFVVVRARRGLAALRADGEFDVATVDDAAIEAGTDLVPGAGAVAGVVTLGDGLLLIHDVERFLTQAEEARLDQALRAADELR